jgi:arginine deiminase
MRDWGVHPEVGILRTVLVRRPGLAHQRLTPGNCHEHRAQVQAASEAYERHKNRDLLVKVKVLVGASP